jgi:class 3 adenylate cyclase
LSADGAVAVTGAAELEHAGLYDPGAPDAAERLALLEYLLGLGATVDELVEAGSAGFPLVASRIALWGPGRRYTLDEVAGRLGVDPATMLRTWRAAGFADPEPGARVFAEPDVEMFEVMQAGLDFFGEDVIVQLLRVLGSAAARIAEASISAFFVNVVPTALGHESSELALARANTDSIKLLDGLTRGFDALVRHHIEQGFRPSSPLEGGGGVDLVHKSIGFADLVGSTPWTQQLDFITLSRALSDFETGASEIVIARRGRVVKLIGDEVMFVTDQASAAVDIGLALIDAFAAHKVLPQVRAGVASGEVVARDGDYSGSVVNLAARALSVAEPSTLLVDRATCGALGDDARFAVGPEREFALKGFDQPVPLCAITRGS